MGFVERLIDLGREEFGKRANFRRHVVRRGERVPKIASIIFSCTTTI